MKLPRKVDVVVVGAGPTGLTLACTLRSANVDVVVLDKVPEGANTSRAAVIHARTLEVLDELGSPHGWSRKASSCRFSPYGIVSAYLLAWTFAAYQPRTRTR